MARTCTGAKGQTPTRVSCVSGVLPAEAHKEKAEMAFGARTINGRPGGRTDTTLYTKKNVRNRFNGYGRLYGGDREGIRTLDPQLRRLLLYPAELPDLTLSVFFNGCKSTSFYCFCKIPAMQNPFIPDLPLRFYNSRSMLNSSCHGSPIWLSFSMNGSGSNSSTLYTPGRFHLPVRNIIAPIAAGTPVV